MKLLIASLCLTAILGLSSCHKDDPKPPVVTPPTDTTTKTNPTGTTGTMNISLTLPGDKSLSNCELIISETSGKKLLDTVAAQGTTITVSMSTNASLVDVSVISMRSSPDLYFVATYKAVNPSNWKTVQVGNIPQSVIRPTSTTQGEIFFKHLPYPSVLWSDFAGSSTGYRYSPTGDSVDISYSYVPGNTGLLLFPYKQMYLVYKPKGLHDTVDCSLESYDTAVTASFTHPSNYSFQNVTLIGISDTTNTSTAVMTYSSPVYAGLPDLMYPGKTKYQAYELTASFSAAATKESVIFYGYGKNVNTTPDFPSAGGYLTGTPQNNNGTVAFGSAKPSYYYLSMGNNNIGWTFYASPDSTTINPLALLTAQNSKLLQGQPLSSLPVVAYHWQSLSGIDYPNYMSVVCGDSARRANLRVATGVSYFKSF